jgi:hypothetical protein
MLITEKLQIRKSWLGEVIKEAKVRIGLWHHLRRKRRYLNVITGFKTCFDEATVVVTRVSARSIQQGPHVVNLPMHNGLEFRQPQGLGVDETACIQVNTCRLPHYPTIFLFLLRKFFFTTGSYVR